MTETLSLRINSETKKRLDALSKRSKTLDSGQDSGQNAALVAKRILKGVDLLQVRDGPARSSSWNP
jgi:hypothetical protein